MRLLSLDLSTKVGWSVLDGKTLLACGRIEHSPSDRREKYPENFINAAKEISARVGKIANSYSIQEVVIEETNQGSIRVSRYAQKILEFIHFTVCDTLIQMNLKPNYVNSKEWQSEVGTKLTKEQRKNNMLLSKSKREVKAELKKKIEEEMNEVLISRLFNVDSKEEARLIKKEVKDELKIRLQNSMRSLRVKVQGIKGKVTSKHLSVSKANEIFGLCLKMKDNDIADSAMLALAYIKIKERGKDGHTNDESL
jgi:hypothetical protein